MSLSMRWNLNDLYTSFDSDRFKEDFELLKKKIVEYNELAEKLATQKDAKKNIEEFISGYTEIYDLALVARYSSLVISVDAENEQAVKMKDVLDIILTDLAKPEVLFSKYIGELENLDEIINSSDELKEHRFILNEVKTRHKYILSDVEEVAISKMKTTGSMAWVQMKEQLYATLTADVTINGEAKTLPMTAIRNMAYDSDRLTRKTAYESELASYVKIDKAVAAALNGVKGEVITVAKMRGYESPLEMTLINSRMKKETLDSMISAMKDYFPVFRKYLRKKAELLGNKNGLPFFDLFAPVGKSNMTFTYDEAADFITKNFSEFSDKLGKFARDAFDMNWVDAEVRAGKRGGAFCANISSIKQSRIMANFSGSFNDVTTLAHELGHAYHGHCIENEKPMNRDYTMPIAETASTFCESLICDAALKNADKEEAFAILETDISGVTQVIVDIYCRFVFESEVFKRRENGALSVNELKEIMINAQKEAYGDGLDENYLHPYMWVCKPHYYYADSNFYNFPYAYGQLFSKGLYAEYKKTGEAFVKKYDILLAATGKNTLEDIAALADIDVTKKDFWVSSLELYAEMIEKFCNLA